MTICKICAFGGTFALLLTGAWLYAADRNTSAPNRDGDLSTLMIAKLATSEKIVEGLVTADFPQIASAAEELRRICDTADWPGQNDPVYMHHRNEMRKQALKVAKMAEQRNLDAATYAYMHSLATCVSCHEYCRDVLNVNDGGTGRSGIVTIPVTVDESPSANNRTIRR